MTLGCCFCYQNLIHPNQCKVVISAGNILISVIPLLLKTKNYKNYELLMLFKYPQSPVMANRFFGDSFIIFEIENKQ